MVECWYDTPETVVRFHYGVPMFIVDEKEAAKMAAWLDEHNKTCPFYDDGTSPSSPSGAIGGRLTYCFTPTGLGVITILRCACGQEVNVTDFENW